MEGISSYRGNRPTNKTTSTHIQTGAIAIHYPLSLARSVTRNHLRKVSEDRQDTELYFAKVTSTDWPYFET